MIKQILPIVVAACVAPCFAAEGWITDMDAAKKQAIQRLYDYEEKLIEKGVQISENNVKIEINHQDCVSRGTLTVIERTGREAPTEKKTQPKERTPEDG